MTAKITFVPGVTKYGKLTILSREGGKWNCKCECGKKHSALVDNIRQGRTTSCGCVRVATHTTHGQSYSYEYRVYGAMMSRVSSGYKKGVVVCRRWAREGSGFDHFFKKMGRAPSEEHSLDRIDNDGNYSCGDCQQCKRKGWSFNCRWATRREQSNNRSNTLLITWKGKTKPASVWCDELGFPRKLLSWRLRQGMSVSEAMATPYVPRGPQSTRANQELYVFKGLEAPLRELVEKVNPSLHISQDLARHRIKKLGWSVSDALKTPNLQAKKK